MPTTLADAEATCNRCLRLRGEGTRRVTTIPEISPLAQSFLSAVRLQCSDLTQYPSNTHAPSLCKALSSSGWVSPRTITVARFQVHIRFIVQLSGCGAALVATLLKATASSRSCAAVLAWCLRTWGCGRTALKREVTFSRIFRRSLVFHSQAEHKSLTTTVCTLTARMLLCIRPG